MYYGALTMPTQFRQINLGAVALTLPSFKIWIYTNGDFKVSVGWPLGDDSIGVQVYIFTGGCGFYFGKLRSGDNPASATAALKAIGSAAATDVVSYNPIVTFGLAMWFGVGRSISAGPFSASLSLTAQGTFQGILAWRDAADGGSVSKTPDYFWFAATVGIVGQLQGEVDLSVVKLSVLVRLSVVAGIAFETGYGTVINVTARGRRGTPEDPVRHDLGGLPHHDFHLFRDHRRHPGQPGWTARSRLPWHERLGASRHRTA